MIGPQRFIDASAEALAKYGHFRSSARNAREQRGRAIGAAIARRNRKHSLARSQTPRRGQAAGGHPKMLDHRRRDRVPARCR
jgi:hypothetical protein